jgi:hypothetical protein
VFAIIFRSRGFCLALRGVSAFGSGRFAEDGFECLVQTEAELIEFGVMTGRCHFLFPI